VIDDEQIQLTGTFHTEIPYLSDFVLLNDRVGFSGGWDGIIRIWDSVEQEEYGTLSIDQESPINDLDISVSHSILASAHTHGVSLWDIRTREKIVDLDSNEFSPRWSIAFNPSNTQITAGSALGTIEIWSLASNELAASWHSVDSGITHIVYSSDGQFLAVRYENDLVQIWNTETLD
jgi:WD40 repeat protein